MSDSPSQPRPRLTSNLAPDPHRRFQPEPHSILSSTRIILLDPKSGFSRLPDAESRGRLLGGVGGVEQEEGTRASDFRLRDERSRRRDTQPGSRSHQGRRAPLQVAASQSSSQGRNAAAACGRGDQRTVESGPCTHGWRTPAAIRTCVSRRGDRTGFVLVGLTVLALRRPVWRPLPHGPGLRLTQRPPPKGQEGPWDPRGLRGDLPVLPRATWGVLPRVQHLCARHRPGQALA